MVSDNCCCFFYDWFLVWVGYIGDKYIVRFNMVYFVDIVNNFYCICVDMMFNGMIFGNDFFLCMQCIMFYYLVMGVYGFWMCLYNKEFIGMIVFCLFDIYWMIIVLFNLYCLFCQFLYFFVGE